MQERKSAAKRQSNHLFIRKLCILSLQCVPGVIKERLGAQDIRGRNDLSKKKQLYYGRNTQKTSVLFNG